VTFVVPGVPDSCQVYLLTSVALKSLPTQRIAGGTRFTFRPDDETFVLMTEDPHVLQSLRQHIARHAERMVLLLRENAALKSAQILETARRMSQSRIQCTAAAQTATSTAALLQQVDAALASQRVEQAYQAAVTANQALEQAAAELRQAVIAPATPHSNPLALGDNTLVEFVAFERARPTFQFGENLLYGGDFEDLGQLTQMGWRHFQGQSSGAESRAELSVAEPRHGSRCLILHAPSASDARSGWDDASVWIESPPMLVAGGQTVEIAGWAHVESHNGETSGELQVIDSVGGSDAALTIRHTNGWERFHLLRAIPDETELRLTFALAGAGSARVDAVMVRSLRRPPSRRPSAVGPAGTAGANSTPTAAGPLLGSPGGTR
jgi:hypothetical protein